VRHNDELSAIGDVCSRKKIPLRVGEVVVWKRPLEEKQNVLVILFAYCRAYRGHNCVLGETKYSSCRLEMMKYDFISVPE
jgi:hypothetical protein